MTRPSRFALPFLLPLLALSSCASTATVHEDADLTKLPPETSSVVLPVKVVVESPLLKERACVYTVRTGVRTDVEIPFNPGNTVLVADLSPGDYRVVEFSCGKTTWRLVEEKVPDSGSTPERCRCSVLSWRR